MRFKGLTAIVASVCMLGGCTSNVANRIGLDWYGGVGVTTNTNIAATRGYHPQSAGLTPEQKQALIRELQRGQEEPVPRQEPPGAKYRTFYGE